MEEKTLHPSFQKRQYLFRKKVFQIFGGAFHVYYEYRNVVFYSKQKAFKLREDFTIFSNENQTEALLTIKTPQILDIGATYNVQDATSGEDVGAVKRKGLKSIFKDEWLFLSNQGRETGKLTESSLLGALLSRFINIIPQSYVIVDPGGKIVAQIKQHFNPFILKYTMTIIDSSVIDPRLIISAGVLLAAIERRQQ